MKPRGSCKKTPKQVNIQAPQRNFGKINMRSHSASNMREMQRQESLYLGYKLAGLISISHFISLYKFKVLCDLFALHMWSKTENRGYFPE